MNEKLYKYINTTDAIKILESNTIVYNNPLNFNDPFDSKIYIDEKQYKKAMNLIVNYVYDREYKKFIYAIYPKLATKKDRALIKSNFLTYKVYEKNAEMTKEYIPIKVKKNIDRAALICQKLGKLSQTQQEELDKLNEKTMYYKEIISKEFKTELRNVVSKIIVTCFSKKNNEILMWSHYADGHKGVCIEFEFEKHQDFFEVVYNKKRKKLNLKELLYRIFYMMNQNEQTPDEALIKLLSFPFVVKSKDWNYEEEVRCIKSLNEGLKELSKGKYLCSIEGKINRIYLGCNISKENEDAIGDLCKVKGIEVLKTKISETSEYELLIENSIEKNDVVEG